MIAKFRLPADANPLNIAIAAAPLWWLPLALATIGILGCQTTQPVRVLNNFVTQLIDVSNLPPETTQYRFVNPKNGWIFISSTANAPKTGEIQLTIDATDVAIRHTAATDKTLEAMRYLPAGQHRLDVACSPGATVKRLIVRTIPEMLSYSPRYTKPQLIEYSPYKAEDLDNDIRRNVNGLILHGSHAPPAPELESWTQQGRRWIGGTGIDWTDASNNYDAWSGLLRKHPHLDGLIADEFCARARISGGQPRFFPDQYADCADAIRRIKSDPTLSNKIFHAYIGDWHRYIWEESAESTQFIQTLIDGGHRAAWERYVREQPTEAEARKYLEWNFIRPTRDWEEDQPGITKSLIFVMGLTNMMGHNLSVHPTVDYKVWMDMQVHTLATDPTFKGLAGFMWWGVSIADEETVRWTSRLFRHYGIEGRTDRLTTDPYMLSHIENPDFDAGDAGWTLTSAEKESIDVRQILGLGNHLQTRVGVTEGNHALWTKRSKTAPNRFEQTIKNLKPGRAYSMKMFTTDHQSVTTHKGKTKDDERTHAVRIEIEGADVDAQNKFQHVYTRPGNIAVNYHWLVFRAKSNSAHLRVSDWRTDDAPGGPIGQELLYNYIEIQPYLED